MKLTGESIIKKSGKELISSKMGSELMAMDMDSGNYIHFNEIGMNIWDHLDDINTISGLVNKLTKEYDISEEDCNEEVKKFINHLIAIELVFI